MAVQFKIILTMIKTAKTQNEYGNNAIIKNIIGKAKVATFIIVFCSNFFNHTFGNKYHWLIALANHIIAINQPISCPGIPKYFGK